MTSNTKGGLRFLLSLNAEHGYFIGVGLTEDPPLMVLTDFHGNALAQHRMREATQPRAGGSGDRARYSGVDKRPQDCAQ